MSVAKLRESTEKKGCMITVWIVMAIALVGLAGSGFLGCFNPALNSQRDPSLNDVMFVVNGQEVTRETMSLELQRIQEEAQPSTGPLDDYALVAGAIYQVVERHLVDQLAAQRRVSVDDQDMLKLVSDQADLIIEQFRASAVAQADLDQNATESQFQEYFSKITGMTTTQYKQRMLDEVQQALDDPKRRQSTLEPALRRAVQDSFYATTTVTDEEVKKSYDKFQVLSVSFGDPEKSLDERMTEAEAALAEIKGGASFESVMRKYMDDPTTEPLPYNRSLLEGNPFFQPILKLQPGQTTDVIVTMGQPQIYKLVAIEPGVPEDYEESKAILNDTYRRQKAGQLAMEALEQTRNSAKIEWKSAGYEATYKVLRAMQNSDLLDEERKAVLLQVVDGTKLSTMDIGGLKVGADARYKAYVEAERLMTEEEAKSRLRTKEEVILGALEYTESNDLRMDLIDVYDKLGEQDALAGALETAAMNNAGFDPQNELVFTQLTAMVGRFETEGKITKPQAQKVRAHLLDWSKRRAEADTTASTGTSNLDEFNVDETGKPIKEAAEEAAKKILEEANKEGGTTGQGN